MVNFSVVMPIHNEEDLLHYSLPSIYRLKPNEIILLFDRCNDQSYVIAKKIAKQYNFESKTQFIKIDESSPDWKFRIAYLRRKGFQLAKNEIILNTDSDIILDQKISKHLKLLEKTKAGMILFQFESYPITFRRFIETLLSIFGPVRFSFGSIYAIQKSAWKKSENQNDIKQLTRCEDSFLYQSIKKKFEIIFVKTKTINLRLKENNELHFYKGVNRWNQKNAPLWIVFLHSFFFLRPLVLSGYLQARFRNLKKQVLIS